MSLPPYRVVYDLASHGYTAWRAALVPLGAVAFAGLFRWLLTRSPSTPPSWAMAHGATQPVTVCVSSMVPEGSDGHPPETVRVGDHVYTYSFYGIGPGFNRTVPRGGPMQKGLCLRIMDLNGKIMRLEVAQ